LLGWLLNLRRIKIGKDKEKKNQLSQIVVVSLGLVAIRNKIIFFQKI